MELRHLRYFVAVAEERHFGHAAERLHMAQPPLSQQIRRLEAELGVQLLDRTTRRVDLTPAGALLLDRARQILADVDDAVEDTKRAARGEVGRLSIGFTGSATYALLPKIAAALREALPDVDLRLHGEMLTPAQVEALVDCTIDLAFLRPPVRRRDLVVEVLRREPLIAVLPAGHRLAKAETVSVRDLADVPFVSYSSHFRSVLHDAVESACEAHGFRPQVALEVGETATLVSFVAAGIGVEYRPLIDDGTPEVELALARRRDDDSPVLAHALDVVRRCVAASEL
jgi:DNA-binding transcriptional LysR family regulator